MNKDVLDILDIVYADYPDEPDWAAVKQRIYVCENPTQVQLELTKTMWLYAEDPAAFEELIYLDRTK